MRLVWIMVALLGVMQPVHTQADSFSREAVLEQFSKDLWHVGKGIMPGDSFSYVVCDFERRFLTQDGSCFHITMDFYIELESQGRDVWVVQAEISDDAANYPHRHIFLMDSETLEVTTDHIGYDYAVSIKKTIMYLAQFAHEQSPKPLIVGEKWGSVSSTLNVGSDLVVVSKETADGIGDVYILDSGLFESSIFVISKDISFPVSALIFDPRYTGIDPPVLFTFELLDYTSNIDPKYDGVIPDSSNGTVTVSGISDP